MIDIFLLLVFCHLLADFPLQGDFLAKAKNQLTPIPGVPWFTALVSHAAIHAGFVWLITGSIALGLVELVLHTGIDHAKCRGVWGFNMDQFLHVVCKWCYIWFLFQ